MEKQWRKIIAHVDMDAFFASVEQLLNTGWLGKPVIVGADPAGGKGRGVVSTASYEARKYGIHSAMPISKAYRLCPQGIFVQPHGHIYQEYSKKVFEILNTFTPHIEALSIDEAFLDLTGSLHLFDSIQDLGERIKYDIKSITSLTASVGISPVKSVAKIASDFNKPDGLTIVPQEKIQDFLDPLPVTRLWGIGEKTYMSLQKMGIVKVEQLRQYPIGLLKKKYGKMGTHIYNMAIGKDERDVLPIERMKSISNELTFNEDKMDMAVIKNIVFALSDKVSGRLRRAKILGKTVSLKIRFNDFKTYTRSHSLNNPTNLTEVIFQTTSYLLNEFDPLRLPVRLIGVGVTNLKDEKGLQMNIWDQDDQKKMKIGKLMDNIQGKYGDDAIMHAEILKLKNKSREEGHK
jgi:DNA polymerase-4